MPCEKANTLRGQIERITFHNRQNHYTIAKFRVAKTNNLVTVLGSLPSPAPGETLKVTGHWETHPQFGPQLRITSYEALLPDKKDELIKYLSSGLISGLGKQTASRLVTHFGEKTVAMIENQPERLKEVSGIGEILAFKIFGQWKTKHALHSLMAFLQENGIKNSYCQRIVKTYGDDAKKILQNEPYRLVHDIPGIGFHIADTIAINAGVSRQDPLRIRTCLLYLLLQAAEAGHTFCFADDLKKQCCESFEINPDLSDDAPGRTDRGASDHYRTLVARIVCIGSCLPLPPVRGGKRYCRQTACLDGCATGACFSKSGANHRTGAAPLSPKAIGRAASGTGRDPNSPGGSDYRRTWNRQNHSDPLSLHGVRQPGQNRLPGSPHRPGGLPPERDNRKKSRHHPQIARLQSY